MQKLAISKLMSIRNSFQTIMNFLQMLVTVKGFLIKKSAINSTSELDYCIKFYYESPRAMMRK